LQPGIFVSKSYANIYDFAKRRLKYSRSSN